MNTPNQEAHSESNEPKLNPEQFSITELLWLLGATAIVLAVATPFIRQLPTAVFNTVLVVISIQSLAIASIVVFVSQRRNTLLKRGGRLLAIGSMAESPSRSRAIAFAVLSILLAILAQLMITVLLSFSFSDESKRVQFGKLWILLASLSNAIAPALFLVNSVRFLRWRIHPSVVEFFENGVATMDTLVPWNDCELRRSNIWSDRMMIYYPLSQSSEMVWLDKDQIDRIIAYVEERKAMQTTTS